MHVDLAMILVELGFLSPNVRDLPEQCVAVLEEPEQKTNFKSNLFTVLAAIQSINLKDHYKLYGSFGLLQH